MLFPALDPTVADHGIVLRVRGIHEQDHVTFLAVLLEVFVVFDEFFLSGGIRLARNQLGLLVDVAETAQHSRHSVRRIAHSPALLDPAGNGLGREVEMLLEMYIQLGQLNRIEQGFATDVVHAQQLVHTALLIALEIGASRVRIDQQRIGDIRRCASPAKENHRIDSESLAHVQRVAVCRAKFIQFLFAEPVVDHPRNLTLLFSSL